MRPCASSSAIRSNRWPSSTLTPLRTRVLKPWARTVTSYIPGASAPASNRPSAPETALATSVRAMSKPMARAPGAMERLAPAMGSPEPLRRTRPASEAEAPMRIRTSRTVIPAPTTTRDGAAPVSAPWRAATWYTPGGTSSEKPPPSLVSVSTASPMPEATTRAPGAGLPSGSSTNPSMNAEPSSSTVTPDEGTCTRPSRFGA